MSKFSHFVINKLYFKQSFNNINKDRGPLFSQINVYQTYFFGEGCPGFFVQGVLSGDLCSGVFFLGVYVLEP